MVFVLFHLFVDVFLKGGHDTYLGGGFTLVLKIYKFITGKFGEMVQFDLRIFLKCLGQP